MKYKGRDKLVFGTMKCSGENFIVGVKEIFSKIPGPWNFDFDVEYD
jgi:hypothetical protein